MKIQAPVVNEKRRSEALSGFQLSPIRQKQDEKAGGESNEAQSAKNKDNRSRKTVVLSA